MVDCLFLSRCSGLGNETGTPVAAEDIASGWCVLGPTLAISDDWHTLEVGLIVLQAEAYQIAHTRFATLPASRSFQHGVRVSIERFFGSRCLVLDVRLPCWSGPDLRRHHEARRVPISAQAIKAGAVEFLTSHFAIRTYSTVAGPGNGTHHLRPANSRC